MNSLKTQTKLNSIAQMITEEGLSEQELSNYLLIEENDLDKKWEFDFNCPNSLSVNIDKLKNFLARDKDILIFQMKLFWKS